jgi:iron complex outermembrane receptor protein
MKTKQVIKTSWFAAFLLFANFMMAQTTISGSVVDSETQETIPGANVIVMGSNTGTATDFDGNFILNTSAELPFTLEISSIGFDSQQIEVTSADQKISVTLNAGQNLDEVIISASRRAEKMQDAPASVSLISARELKNSPNVTDPVRNLVNIPGVQIQQQSANSLNIEMRAGSGVFGTSTFPILDYRYLVTPSAGSFLSYQTGLSNIDIERIEVVRGAASALYGPGVTSGVVHFLTKKPIDYPGTTVEMYGGNLSSVGGSVRHAARNESKTFGYKINARYNRGDDFNLDPVEDADFISTFQSSVRQPAIKNNVVDATQVGTTLLSSSDLDPDGDGNPLASEYENFSVNAHLEFRPNDNTSGVIAGGLNSGGGLFFNSQGAGYTQGNDYWAQARLQKGGLFAQAYYNYNDGGNAENPTFLYGTGYRQVAKRTSLEAQIQYNFDAPNFLDSNFTFGADYRNTGSDSEYTLYGRNDDDDPYVITGIYGQGTSRLGDKIDLTYALRYDQFNFVEEGAIAPRIAMVYKMSPRSSLRVSYNVATFGPSALQTYIDFPVSTLAPGVLDVWLSGQIDQQNFAPDAGIELSGQGVTLPYGTSSLPLAIPYGAVAAPSIAGLIGILQSSPDTAPLVPSVQNFFNSYGGPALNKTTGTLSPYNLFNGEPMNTLTGTDSAKIGTLKSWEVGYKGLLGDKWSLGVDVYTYERSGFDQFTAIGPTYAFSGLENIGNDLGAAVAADFAADPTLQAVIAAGTAAAVNAQVQAGVEAQYTANGIPEAFWATGVPADALAPGSPAVPSVADATAATAAGIIPGAIAEATALLNGGVAQAFALGGAGYAQQVTPLAAAFGTVESLRVPQGDGITHIPAGYRRFGDATRSHVGADLSLKYRASDNWSWWGNASWLSQNVWIPGEDNDDDLPFSSYLNAPKFKYRAGVNYTTDGGFRAALAFQHDDEFESNQGFFSGLVQEKNLFDLNLGYQINEGFGLDLSATNLFDQKYRAFPSMPIIGRRVLLKATFDF